MYKRQHYGISTNPPATEIGEVIHVDIHTFSHPTIGKNTACLISSDEISQYVKIYPMKSKGNVALFEATNRLVEFYKGHGFSPKRVQSDSESSFHAIRDNLLSIGIELKTITPYQHEQRMERIYRSLNNGFRSVILSLNYDLPKSLYMEVLFCVAYHWNALICTHQVGELGSNMLESRQMMVEGIKYDINRHPQYPFGTLALFLDIASKEGSNIQPKAEMGIILGPAVSSDSILSLIHISEPTRRS